MKVLFYSNNCKFCNELVSKINESNIKDLKMVCIDENNSFENIKIVPTIIDSNYNEILEGKKAFDYINNKKFFDFPTSNILVWQEKEIPDPKIKNDKLAIDMNINSLDDINFNKSELKSNLSESCLSENSNDNKNLMTGNRFKEVESIDSNTKDSNSFLKNAKLSRTSSLLLRRR
mgnify:CR=1 FL=1